MLRLLIPIEPGASPRACLEAQIEFLLALLDRIDADPDLEDGADLEHGGDDEPSLGSFDAMPNQEHAYQQEAFWLGVDLEEDRSDFETVCWGNPLGAVVGVNGRLGWGLIEERVPDRQTARRKEIYEALHPETAHGTNQHERSRQTGESSSRFTKSLAAATGQSERTVQRGPGRQV